jgi:hypothetical protein
MKTRIFLILIGALLLGTFSSAPAQAPGPVPRTISFQGVLASSDGQFISDGLHEIQLRIYETPAGGPAVFVEKQNVLVLRGVFNVMIGSTLEEGLPMSLPFDRAYFLGVSVDGRTELAPRTPFSAVPYALYAQKSMMAYNAEHAVSADDATHADNADMADQAKQVVGGVVTSVNGVKGNIDLVGSGNTSITRDGNEFIVHSKGLQMIRNYDGSLQIYSAEGPIVDMSIGVEGIATEHLQDRLITTRKVSDEAITNPKLAPASVTTPKIAGNAVDAACMSTSGATMYGQVLTYDGESRTPFWSNMFTGTFEGDGMGLSLTADSLVQGTIDDARLSPNVVLLDADNVFTADTNSFEGVKAGGLRIAAPIGEKGLDIVRGRTILSYATVEDEEIIPSDANVVQIDGPKNWRWTDVRLPATEENGQVLWVVCNDPDGCLVYDPIDDEENGEERSEGNEGTTDPQMELESEMNPETFEMGRLVPYKSGRVFVRTGIGWLWIF